MTPTTSTGDDLLAGVLANPDDDTVRLVYADYLQENDQGERAEFIRVQVELSGLQGRYPYTSRTGHHEKMHCRRRRGGKCGSFARGTHCDRCNDLAGIADREKRKAALVAREQELLSNIARSFADGFLDWHTHCRVVGANTVQFDSAPGNNRPQDASIITTVARGFIESVTCTATDWITHADELVAAHPIERVTITTYIMCSWTTDGQLRVSSVSKSATRIYEVEPVHDRPSAKAERFAVVWPGITFDFFHEPPLTVDQITEMFAAIGIPPVASGDTPT